MIKRIKRYVQGYIQISLYGNSVERFLNLCRNKQISLWEIQRNGEKVTCFVDLRERKSMRKLEKKTKTRVKIERKIGLPFVLYKCNKRKAFFIAISWFFLVLFGLSSIVWGIEITGQERYTKERILYFIKSKDVYGGMLCKNVRCKEIEDEIRKQYPDIGWVSAELEGGKLTIQILENIVKEEENTNKKHTHLSSGLDGKIVSIVTRTGMPKVHAGDEIKAGDILISGVVDIVGDNGECIGKEKVYADGDIWVESEIMYNKQFPMEYNKRVETGRKMGIYGLYIGKLHFHTYNPLKKFETYEKYDIINFGDSLHVNSVFELPVSWSIRKYHEVKIEKKRYTDKEAKQRAKDVLAEDIRVLEEAGIVIVDKNIQTQIKESQCTTSGFIRIQSLADKRIKIKKSQWRMEQSDELDGNSDSNSSGT